MQATATLVSGAWRGVRVGDVVRDICAQAGIPVGRITDHGYRVGYYVVRYESARAVLDRLCVPYQATWSVEDGSMTFIAGTWK